MEASLHARLRGLQLLVVTGKGGTGKSVMTAALGRSLALAGRRTLMLEVDPRENLHQLCDVPPSGGEIVEVRQRLYLQNLKPAAVVDWIVERQLKIRLLVDRVRASRVYQRFVEGAPGLTEMAILGHALRLVRGDRSDAPRVDTVVLDAPASGHGLYLLSAARLFADAIGEGPIAELAREVAELVADPARTGLVIVGLAEEMPTQEAIELVAELAEVYGRGPELVVVNGLYPPASEEDPGGDDDLAVLWRRRREVNELELARLARHGIGPRIELPLIPVDDGPHLVRLLQERLDQALAERREETAE